MHTEHLKLMDAWHCTHKQESMKQQMYTYKMRAPLRMSPWHHRARPWHHRSAAEGAAASAAAAPQQPTPRRNRKIQKTFNTMDPSHHCALPPRFIFFNYTHAIRSPLCTTTSIHFFNYTHAIRSPLCTTTSIHFFNYAHAIRSSPDVFSVQWV